MNKYRTECERIRDYLDGQLPLAEHTRFELHLGTCEECARAMDFDRQLDALLPSVMKAMTEISPPAVAGLERRVRSRIRVATTWVALQALAALLLVALSVWVVRAWFAGSQVAVVHPETMRAQKVVDATPRAEEDHMDDFPSASSNSVMNGDATVTVDVADDSRYLPVPLETSNPNVTIIWFYPVVVPTASNATTEEPSSMTPRFDVFSHATNLARSS